MLVYYIQLCYYWEKEGNIYFKLICSKMVLKVFTLGHLLAAGSCTYYI